MSKKKSSKQAKAPANGDGVQVVDGRPPKESTIGMRVVRVNVKEAEDGSASGEATVVGITFKEASNLIPTIGQDVALRTAGDGRKQTGILRAIGFTAGKDGKPGKVSIKVGGGRALDQMIGVGVKIEPLQKSLLP